MMGIMTAVIIAGGSGTRLWPLSTPEYPKHLLKVNGDKRSLLQHTYDRARRLTDKVYVVSEASHIHHVREQLPELQDDAFVVEPARRGTASCIVAALAHVAAIGCDADEALAVLSADHYIRDTAGFAHSFKIAAGTSESQKRIVLVGVEPDYPATGFGYIEKGELLDEDSFVFNVDSFREKPAYNLAKTYVESGNYLWNCGYFVASINTFKREMKKYAPRLLDNYEALLGASPDDYQAVYLGFENDTIDYALIEKVGDLLVVPASFDWMDLGSFADLAKAASADETGNHLSGRIELEDVKNSFVQNHEAKPVAIIGLDNVVVVNTPHGLLVTRKDLSQKVGEVSKRLNGGAGK